MPQDPLVSVVMPVFNSEAFLFKAINSILNQTYSNWELIILNDGSTDGSVDIIHQFDDPRIKLYHNEKNEGLAITRNKLFSFISAGKYIAILDSDDIALPHRFEKQVHFLENNKEYGLIASSVNFINENDEVVGSTMHFPAKPKNIPSILFYHNYFIQSAVMMKREIIEEGYLYRIEYPPCEDYDLWIRLSEKYILGNLPEVLVHYRNHQNNISKNRADLRESREKQILADQLKRIGVHPSPEQFNFYFYSLKLHQPIVAEWKQCMAWLKEIIKAAEDENSGRFRYLPTYTVINFLKSLVKKWLKNISSFMLLNKSIKLKENGR